MFTNYKFRICIPLNSSKAIKGFTIIEVLSVIAIASVLSVLATSRFIDFRVEAKLASARAFSSLMRNAITAKKVQLSILCEKPSGSNNPSLESVVSNDVIAGGDCTAEQVPDPQARKFVDTASMQIPVNPANGLNNIVACPCNDVCDTKCSAMGGACYNPQTMLFWMPGVEAGCGEVVGSHENTDTPVRNL